tara:strand:- start:7 stop:222 length:216 start_codon:yes stop_codon:yes gene_type:complete
MNFQETRWRSIIKTISWRIIAIVNSFVILVSGLAEGALLNALYMNLTGFVLYYFFERICNRLPYGKIEEKK